MINHVRTLLMNQSGARDPRAIGEEYVPTEFRRRALPPVLQAFHRVLFGTAPDRLFLNYRLRQLTTLLHATELSDYVTLADSRVTYEPTPTRDLFNRAFKIEVTAPVTSSTAVYVQGSVAADEGAGRCGLQWSVKLESSEIATVQRLQPRSTAGAVPYVIENGLSSELSLPGSNLRFRFRDAAVGSLWYINATARPADNLGAVLSRCRTIVRSSEAVFFSRAPKTLREVWSTHPLDTYRYAAMLLAFAGSVSLQAEAADAPAVVAATPPPEPAEDAGVTLTNILTLWPPFGGL